MSLKLLCNPCKERIYGSLVPGVYCRRAKCILQPAVISDRRAKEAVIGSTSRGTIISKSQSSDADDYKESLEPEEASSGTKPTTIPTAAGSSLLGTPQQQAAGFLVLTAASLAFSAAALAAPDFLLSLAVGGDHGVLDVAFTRIAGATMLISAAVEYSLGDAVTAGHLKSVTYQRLLLAVMVKDVLYLAAFLTCPNLWSPLLVAIYAGSAGVSLLITTATLQSAFLQSGAASALEGVTAAAGGLGLPKSRAGWAYRVFILLYLATVAACYAPEVIFSGQPMTATGELLKHTWAPGFLLAAAACWVLSGAADRDRLAASTFRRLNLGLAGTEAGYTAVFAWSISTGLAVNDASSWSNLVGSVGITTYCLYQYFAIDQSRQ